MLDFIFSHVIFLGQNMYKSIMLNNSERTPSVIRSAMMKHSLENEDENHYTLSQILPDGGKTTSQILNYRG